ncbi:hypothetical protein FF1_041684 [Malus domestica]
MAFFPCDFEVQWAAVFVLCIAALFETQWVCEVSYLGLGPMPLTQVQLSFPGAKGIWVNLGCTVHTPVSSLGGDYQNTHVVDPSHTFATVKEGHFG